MLYFIILFTSVYSVIIYHPLDLYSYHLSFSYSLLIPSVLMIESLTIVIISIVIIFILYLIIVNFDIMMFN
jgi:hypothetical protein